jgi:hypothetical protein
VTFRLPGADNAPSAAPAVFVSFLAFVQAFVYSLHHPTNRLSRDRFQTLEQFPKSKVHSLLLTHQLTDFIPDSTRWQAFDLNHLKSNRDIGQSSLEIEDGAPSYN